VLLGRSEFLTVRFGSIHRANIGGLYGVGLRLVCEKSKAMAAVEHTRSRVEAALREAPDGLDVPELAVRLGLHPNTVRWHLGALGDAGAVSSAPHPRASRGRPRIVYRLEPAREAGTREEYRLLASVLSSAVAGPEAAELAGHAWGRYLVPRRLPLVRADDAEARRTVCGLLAEQGFAPESTEGEIRMRRCPFHDLAETQPEIICAVHKGLIEGAFEELGSDLRIEGLDVFVEPDLCVARLSRTPPAQ
jgi:predicted ArsR family transcriptional regulator